jgi:hypothetical protein
MSSEGTFGIYLGTRLPPCLPAGRCKGFPAHPNTFLFNFFVLLIIPLCGILKEVLTITKTLQEMAYSRYRLNSLSIEKRK